MYAKINNRIIIIIILIDARAKSNCIVYPSKQTVIRLTCQRIARYYGERSSRRNRGKPKLHPFYSFIVGFFFSVQCVNIHFFFFFFSINGVFFVTRSVRSLATILLSARISFVPQRAHIYIYIYLYYSPG